MATRTEAENLERFEQAGFNDVADLDVTEDYARTQQAWLEANEARAAEVRRLTSDLEFATAQADRRAALAAIEEGLLRRSLITAAPLTALGRGATAGAPGAASLRRR